MAFVKEHPAGLHHGWYCLHWQDRKWNHLEIIIIIHKINLTYIKELPSLLRKRLDLSVQLAPIPGVVTELQGDHQGDDNDDCDTNDDDGAGDEVTPGQQQLEVWKNYWCLHLPFTMIIAGSVIFKIWHLVFVFFYIERLFFYIERCFLYICNGREFIRWCQKDHLTRKNVLSLALPEKGGGAFRFFWHFFKRCIFGQ